MARRQPAAQPGGQGGEPVVEDSPFDEEAEAAHLRDIERGIDDEEGDTLEIDHQDEAPGRVAPREGKSDLGEDEEDEEEESGKDERTQFQKRIDRLTAVRKSAEEDAVAARREVATEREARTRAENAMAEANRFGATASLEGLKSAKERVKAALTAAKEAGETAKEVDLTDELTDLNTKINSLTAYQSRNPAPKAGPQPAAPQQQQQQAAPVGRARFKPAAQPWYDRNKTWFDDPRNSVARAAVVAIDRDLAGEGYAPDSEDWYVELDKRLRGVPGVATQAAGGNAQQRGRQRVAGVGRDSGGPTIPAKGRVQVSEEDKALMRTFKLDPAKDEHVKEFFRQRRAG